MASPMTHQARELVLHAGLAKTGSSAIQRALLSNKQALLEQCGILFPGDQENHFLLQAAFSDNPASMYQIQMLGLSEGRAVADHLRHFRQGLLTEIERTRPRRILFSSEYFTAMSVYELRSLRQFLQPLARHVVVMVYVRDPWTHAVSAIQELVRTGRLQGDTKLGYVMSNVEIIAKFEQAFDCRVTAVPYAQEGASQEKFNVVEDFCNRLGIPASVIDPSQFGEVNPGMRREAAIAMLHLNRKYPTLGADGSYIADPARDWMIEALLSSSVACTPIRLSKATASEIYDESRSDLEHLQYRYFGGSPVLSDKYESIATTDGSDVLRLDSPAMEHAYDYLLECMRPLAEMAAQQFVERVYWTGKCYRAEGNLVAAAACFSELLAFSPHHARRHDAEAALAALKAESPLRATEGAE
jgi:hypothetical protein